MIKNGAYSAPASPNQNISGSTLSQLTEKYGFAVSGDLCLASTDIRNSNKTAFQWAATVKQCDDLFTDGMKWRLPNIAELSNLQNSKSAYGMTNIGYWSSTGHTKNSAYNFHFATNNPSNLDKIHSNLVRCVRSL